MSNLNDRRGSPRREIRHGGMMPGYFVMFTGIMAGAFGMCSLWAAGMWAAMVVDWWWPVITSGIMIGFFAMSAHRAENLVDRPKPSNNGDAQ